MNGCRLSGERLQQWMDGEAGSRADEIEQHVRQCQECQCQVALWRRVNSELVGAIDSAVGEVDTLSAVAAIRARVVEREESSFASRLGQWSSDLLVFHRRALAGVAVAVALGALSAPVVVYLTGRYLGIAPTVSTMAGVVIESMDSDTRAVVHRSGGGSTTLIWVDPNDSKGNGAAGPQSDLERRR